MQFHTTESIHYRKTHIDKTSLHNYNKKLNHVSIKGPRCFGYIADMYTFPILHTTNSYAYIHLLLNVCRHRRMPSVSHHQPRRKDRIWSYHRQYTQHAFCSMCVLCSCITCLTITVFHTNAAALNRHEMHSDKDTSSLIDRYSSA